MKQLLFILFTFCVISNTYAQMDCESIPSCAEMGYTQDSCAGGKGVRCPFDENKFYCAGVKQLPDAPEPVVTPEDWTAECADKINYCTAYNTECQCTACESGYLLSDGACVPECDKSVDICAAENKTFNSANCVCEACPENYEFNSETKACEQIACDTTKVEHCTTYSSDYEPCTCQTCETNYLLVDGVCVLQCSGANQCLYQGSCVTCYESCPVRWQYYLDEEPDGSACSLVERIYQGSGFGAEAVEKPCYNDCATCQKACELFAGLDNTTDAVAQLGNKGLAFYAATQFYVGNKNGAFGQGQWYLPSIGEWMEFYGTEISNAIPAEYSSAGATGDNMALIKNALNILKNKGVEAEPLSGYYWSSTSRGSSNVAALNASDGRRVSKCSYYECSSSGETSYVRCSLFLTLTTNGTAPAIGDVVYLDKTYGAASDYDGSKTPVGIIAAVSGNDVKIINLKNLTFSSKNTVGNFDPDNPYSGITEQTAFLPKNSIYLHDITGNFVSNQFSNAIRVMNKYNCTCSFKPGACTLSTATCAAESKVFKEDTCTCEACPENSKFNATTNSCDLCTRDIPYCYSYKDNCTCRSCDSGYKLSSNACVCAKNVEGCASYTSEAEGCKCTACQSGYELYENSDYDVLTCEKIACNLDTFASEGDECPAEWAYTSKGVNSCVPGAILYNDFQCYLPNEVPEGVVAIGIVVDSMPLYDETTKTYSNTHNRVRAIAIEDNSEAGLLWSENLYENEAANCYYDNQFGWNNTDCIIEASAEETSAAAYCKAYHKTEADKGKWYLPAIDELIWALGTNEYWESKKPCCVIWGLYRNNAPTEISPVDYLSSTFYEPDNGYGRLSKPLTYWSSTAPGDKWNPTNGASAKCLRFAKGNSSSCYRNKEFRVRCMIQVAVPYRQMSAKEAQTIVRKYLDSLNN